MNCSAQTFNCGAAAIGIDKVKLEQQIIVTDSTVVFISSNQEQSSKRIKSDYNIYYTDGVMTHTLTVSPQTGKARGFVYNCTVMMKPDARLGTSSAIYYCRKD